MTLHTTVFASLVALCSMAACGAETDSDSPAGDGAVYIRIADWRPDGRLDDQRARANLEYTEILDVDAEGLIGGLCACDTAACRKAYVEETYGCDICIDAVCDGELAGGCFFCDVSFALAPTGTSAHSALR